LSATELLQKNPNPSTHEIKEAVAGNLCRCTGYEPIIEAIAASAGDKAQEHKSSHLPGKGED
jgi:carbon-monoxide dehydrogenase small subunit